MTQQEALALTNENRPLMIKSELEQIYGRIKTAALLGNDRIGISDIGPEIRNDLENNGFAIDANINQFIISWAQPRR